MGLGKKDSAFLYIMVNHSRSCIYILISQNINMVPLKAY